MAMECEGFAPSPSPVERHYHQRYILRDNDAGQPEDTYIHFHDNGSPPLHITRCCCSHHPHPLNASPSPPSLYCSIAVIGLATSHCMMAQQETVVKG